MMRALPVTAFTAFLLAACAPDPSTGSVGATSDRAAARSVERGASPTSEEAVGGEPVTEAGTTTGTAAPDFSRRRAMAHVRRLAGRIGTRVRGHRGEWRASRYIARRLRELGYEVDVQAYEVDARRSRNVVAWWPDAMRYPVVVGAHMDTVPRSPGANDNASGVAAMLEIARLVAGAEQARFVRFVAFGSEEYGADGSHHVGSQVFVNRLGERGRKRLAGMVSVDMVADGRPLLVGTAGIGPEVVARSLYRTIRDAGIATRYRTLCDCSDNGPFERAGIPGSFMWSGDEPNYHSPSDTVANMVPDDLRRTGRALRAFVFSLDRTKIERFRRS